mgnify:CR=1 FL=1
MSNAPKDVPANQPASKAGRPPVTSDDITAAASSIAGSVAVTECDQSRTLSEICGCNVWLKFENLQFTSTFKERGALNRLLALSADDIEPAQRRKLIGRMVDQFRTRGVGNLYKTEVCFLLGLSPWTLVRDVPDPAAAILELKVVDAHDRRKITFVSEIDDIQVVEIGLDTGEGVRAEAGAMR